MKAGRFASLFSRPKGLVSFFFSEDVLQLPKILAINFPLLRDPCREGCGGVGLQRELCESGGWSEIQQREKLLY